MVNGLAMIVGAKSKVVVIWFKICHIEIRTALCSDGMLRTIGKYLCKSAKSVGKAM